jgi:hypothetical protein
MAKTTMTKIAMSSKTASVKVRGTSKATSIYTETIAIDDSRAMRDERVVVVDYSAGAVPIESPMVLGSQDCLSTSFASLSPVQSR